MRLPGYRRPEPDPLSVGVMAATPPRWRGPQLPRPHWHPWCWLRGHVPARTTLKHRGEKWGIHLDVCKRCARLLDGAHAKAM